MSRFFVKSKFLMGSLLLIGLFSFLQTIEAGVYKCEVNGLFTFQDRPCAAGKETSVSKAEVNDSDNDNPTSLHPSWMRSPTYLKSRVVCSEESCVCGQKTYKLQGEGDRLMNAIASLKERWRAHDRLVARYQQIGADHIRFPAVKGNTERSACNLAVEQATIRKFYVSDSKEIFQNNDIAKKALQANKDACGEQPGLSGRATNAEKVKWLRCKDANRGEHNKRVRLSKSKSKRYKHLAADLKYLQKPRQATQKK